jgi:hypothetical protein
VVSVVPVVEGENAEDMRQGDWQGRPSHRCDRPIVATSCDCTRSLESPDPFIPISGTGTDTVAYKELYTSRYNSGYIFGREYCTCRIAQSTR